MDWLLYDKGLCHERVKYETPLLFFLIIFNYIPFDQQSSTDVLQIGVRKIQAAGLNFKETPRQVFSCEISKIFKNTFFKNTFKEQHWWLLLYILYTHDVTFNLSR